MLMLVSPRLTEYIFTGSTFWVGQLLVLLVALPILRYSGAEVSPFESLSAHVNSYSALPVALHGIASGLASVIAIIFVITTGFILELVRPYFVYAEILIFQDYLDLNSGWLGPLMDSQDSSIRHAYHLLATNKRYSNPMTPRSYLVGISTQIQKLVLNLLRPFLRLSRHLNRRKRSLEKLQETFIQEFNGFQKLIPMYERLLSFFCIYINTFAGNSVLTESLADKQQIWKYSRSLGVSIAFIIAEAILIIFSFAYTLVYSHAYEMHLLFGHAIPALASAVFIVMLLQLGLQFGVGFFLISLSNYTSFVSIGRCRLFMEDLFMTARMIEKGRAQE